MGQALYREWRPATFAQVVGQAHAVTALRNAVRQGRVSHAYLFTGPRGTGKTSLAKILARAVNCLDPRDGEPCGACVNCVEIQRGAHLDVTELDAASNRGIEQMRDLREKIRYAPTSAARKVYIVDEVHALTADAANAILKTLEEPPPHALFLLCTTDPDRLPETVLSRCQRFALRRLKPEEMVERLERIAADIGMVPEPGVVAAIAVRAEGGLRDAIGLLEQLWTFAGDRPTMAQLVELQGGVRQDEVDRLFEILEAGDGRGCVRWLDDVCERGAEPREVARDLARAARARMRAAVERTGRVDPGWLAVLERLQSVTADSRGAGDPRLALELCLYRCAEAISPAQAAPAPPAGEPRAAAAGEPERAGGWNELLARVRARDRRVWALLQGARGRAEDRVVEIVFAFPAHREEAGRPEFMAVMRQAVQDVWGEGWTIRLGVAPGSAKEGATRR